MQIIGKNLNQDEFRNYVGTYDFGVLPPNKLIIHHTSVPSKKDWSGEKTLRGIKDTYQKRGWSAGPHIFVAEDGIWLFTPMYDVGIHAEDGNATWSRFGRTYTGFRGPTGSRLVEYSVGIEVVGDYSVDQWSGKTKSNVLAVMRILMKRLNIQNNQVLFHRDVDATECPGHAITKEWLFKQLAKRNAEGSRIEQNRAVVSDWAEEGWDWQIDNNFDRYIHPHEPMNAQAVYHALYKFKKLFLDK